MGLGFSALNQGWIGVGIGNGDGAGTWAPLRDIRKCAAQLGLGDTVPGTRGCYSASSSSYHQRIRTASAAQCGRYCTADPASPPTAICQVMIMINDNVIEIIKIGRAHV